MLVVCRDDGELCSVNGGFAKVFALGKVEEKRSYLVFPMATTAQWS